MLKNMAIVAHVDHGKTTLIDGLLRQSETLNSRDEIQERAMDSGELEREKGITIRAKNCAIFWKGTKINLLDTPGHSDFGGEVERSIMMVDGVLLLVDASEGPLPQTRYVLTKAIQSNLKIGVVINKVDRPDERIDEVIKEIEDLFLDIALSLGQDDFDFQVPIYYASAKLGFAMKNLGDPRENLNPLLDFMVGDYFSTPKVKGAGDFQMLIANLAHSAYLGQQMIGRIERGTVTKNSNYVLMDEEQKNKNFKVTSVQMYHGLATKEVESASAGEIVIISGTDNAKIGDTLCAPAKLEALPRIKIDPPTVSVIASVNTSPGCGTEGEYLTGRKLEEMLSLACKQNVSLSYATTEDPKEFELKGRGELQLTIVFEEIRRKGFELMIARPQVLIKEVDGVKLEPYELVVMDIPQDFVGSITDLLSQRKGIMTALNPIGDTRTRLQFEIPSRGLIGFRSQFLTETKGEGIISSQFLDYRPFSGETLSRGNGAICSDRAGKATPYALFNLLSSGRQIIKPGDTVYEGQVVGESTKKNDINVNVAREKHVSSVRTAGKDENIILPPVTPMTLEKAIEWIDADEWIEITPKNIRIRKKVLDRNKRTTIRDV